MQFFHFLSLTNVLPSIISGSIIIEFIFGLPGIGQLLIKATFNKNWPIILAMSMLIGGLTLLNYLIIDILYKKTDNRIEI